MKELLLGNEAVARGLYESGVSLVSSYPGTPSTEITEYASTYKDMHSEWAPNEKVALEVSIGASIAGKRSFSAMKHVGLNVAADPLYTASYTGVNGGLVIAVADDPGMHSSQNEQDSRHHARASKVPILEPSTSMECIEYTKLAYEISEKYDTPVLLRLTTRIAHSRSLCTLSPREERETLPYEKNPAKYVMMPAMARGRHVVVEERTKKLVEYAEKSGINKIEYNDKKIGIISSGVGYVYAKEALGKKASYLKLGMSWPLPVGLIRDFARNVEKIYVVEELESIFEEHCKALGINVTGKEIFSPIGEYSQNLIKEKILGEKAELLKPLAELPIRPPVMCAGCPHRGVFHILKTLGCYVSGDIGCYTLGATAPLSAMDTTICMGASISSAHGVSKAVGRQNGLLPVSIIGDSTFIHTGINSLINCFYNGSKTVIIIVDNSITGMTGHQQNPASGYNIHGEPANAVNIEALCASVGAKNIQVIDPYDTSASFKAIEEAVKGDETAVIISRRPCALLKSVVHEAPLTVDEDKCTGCRQCLKIGCPAASVKNRKMIIDKNQCVGCGLCVPLCRFSAIVKEGM